MSYLELDPWSGQPMFDPIDVLVPDHMDYTSVPMAGMGALGSAGFGTQCDPVAAPNIAQVEAAYVQAEQAIRQAMSRAQTAVSEAEQIAGGVPQAQAMADQIASVARDVTRAGHLDKLEQLKNQLLQEEKAYPCYYWDPGTAREWRQWPNRFQAVARAAADSVVQLDQLMARLKSVAGQAQSAAAAAAAAQAVERRVYEQAVGAQQQAELQARREEQARIDALQERESQARRESDDRARAADQAAQDRLARFEELRLQLDQNRLQWEQDQAAAAEAHRRELELLAAKKALEPALPPPAPAVPPSTQIQDPYSFDPGLYLPGPGYGGENVFPAFAEPGFTYAQPAYGYGYGQPPMAPQMAPGSYMPPVPMPQAQMAPPVPVPGQPYPAGLQPFAMPALPMFEPGAEMFGIGAVPGQPDPARQAWAFREIQRVLAAGGRPSDELQYLANTGREPAGWSSDVGSGGSSVDTGSSVDVGAGLEKVGGFLTSIAPFARDITAAALTRTQPVTYQQSASAGLPGWAKALGVVAAGGTAVGIAVLIAKALAGGSKRRRR